MPEEFARQDPASVPAIIAAWLKALQGLEQAHHIQQAVLDLLNSRSGHTQAKPAQVTLRISVLPMPRRLSSVSLENIVALTGSTFGNSLLDGVKRPVPNVLTMKLVTSC